MRRTEAGFTLIELVIVLVILGILSAVAIPKFQDFSTDAKKAANAGGLSTVYSALAIGTANLKRPPTGTELVGYMTGASCASGNIEISGTSGQVKVALTPADCSSTVTAIGAASYSG